MTLFHLILPDFDDGSLKHAAEAAVGFYTFSPKSFSSIRVPDCSVAFEKATPYRLLSRSTSTVFAIVRDRRSFCFWTFAWPTPGHKEILATPKLFLLLAHEYWIHFDTATGSWQGFVQLAGHCTSRICRRQLAIDAKNGLPPRSRASALSYTFQSSLPTAHRNLCYIV